MNTTLVQADDPIGKKLLVMGDVNVGKTTRCRQWLQSLCARGLGPRIVVATRGSRGSMAYDGQRFYGQGIVPCRVVDTMGAGDSLLAGFLHSWLEGLDIPGCMASGAQCSAVTLAYEGAW